jgi:hypothetical protein
MQYKVTNRVRVTGMEIDLLAKENLTAEIAFIECKFISEPFDAPIISKLVGNAMSHEEVSRVYLITTSEPGKEAKGVLYEYERKGNKIRGILNFVYISPDKFTKLYLETYGYPNLEERITLENYQFSKELSSGTLVITPLEAFWVIEHQSEGLPDKAFTLPLDPNYHRIRDIDGFRKLAEENKTWQGLPFVNGLVQPDFQSESINATKIRKEFITQIPVADKFDDYGPARPIDFVGRTELIKDIISFLENVRQGTTSKRVLALFGPSGFGKSSVILKLTDKTGNQKYRNRIFFYHVDTRAAASPLFVLEAIRSGFKKSIDDGFINLHIDEIVIESTEDPLSSTSIQQCLSALRAEDRILVVFFDQFEELLTKENLLSTFEVLRRVALQVEALQTNLILGFSWRTGISFPEDHPAYHLWHSLQDKRVEFRIGLFSNSESVEMVNLLEKNIGKRLEAPLRRNILEQAQRFPWFLKKLCIHVYRQLLSEISQKSLMDSQLDAAILFDEDTRN